MSAYIPYMDPSWGMFSIRWSPRPGEPAQRRPPCVPWPKQCRWNVWIGFDQDLRGTLWECSGDFMGIYGDNEIHGNVVDILPTFWCLRGTLWECSGHSWASSGFLEEFMRISWDLMERFLWFLGFNGISNQHYPIYSMYGTFNHIWVIFRANVGKYSSTMEHLGMICGCIWKWGYTHWHGAMSRGKMINYIHWHTIRFWGTIFWDMVVLRWWYVFFFPLIYRDLCNCSLIL